MVDQVTAAMRELAAELKTTNKKFASAVRKEIRKAVTEAGADLVADVKAAASWSKRIPAATYIRPNFTARSAGIRIVVNRRKAPHARPLEMGNGTGGSTFTHPVFGNRDDLVKQPMHPFFFKTIDGKSKQVEGKFLDAIDKACRDAKFR